MEPFERRLAMPLAMTSPAVRDEQERLRREAQQARIAREAQAVTTRRTDVVRETRRPRWLTALTANRS
jgi:hypothetical protein